MTRPGEIEINAWKGMLGDMDGAENWGWESFYAAMKKSENFTAPSESIAQEANITWNTADHGTSGPIHASYTGLYGHYSSIEQSQQANLDIARSLKSGSGKHPW